MGLSTVNLWGGVGNGTCVRQSTLCKWGQVGKPCQVEYGKSVGRSRATMLGGV